MAYWRVALCAVLAAVQGQAYAKAAKAKRTVSPWFVYQGPESIEALKPQADLLSSISVASTPPREFVQQCHDLGIQVYLLVGGKDGAEFETPERRRQLIRTYLDRCRDQGFDGVDLDFEGLDPECRDNYSALLREASRALHRAGKRLAMCVSWVMCTRHTGPEPRPGGPDIDNDWYDPAVVGRTCDQVRVMCYDMHSTSGGSVGPVSTRPWARDAMQFWAKHVPREKLVMGLPAYSRDYALTPSRDADTPYAAVPQVPEGTPLQRAWLPYEEIHLYRYADAKGVPHLFYASDAASTRAHLRTAVELGLPTVGFWHFGAVTPEAWAAVREWVSGE